MADVESPSVMVARTLSGGHAAWETLLTRVLEVFGRLSRRATLALALLFMLLLATADYLLANELRLQVFYWVPIALVAWFAGRRWGLAAVVLSSLLWTAAHFTLYLEQNQLSYLAWNFAVNLFSFAALGYLVAKLKELVDHQRDLARTDFTTGVPNARAFSEVLQAEIQRGARSNRPLSLAYLDLDDFKRVNDTLGHDAGDDVLLLVASTVRSSLRGSDVVARLGGDEFAILLPDTGAEAAAAVIHRVHERIEALPEARAGLVSVSVGLLTCASCPGSHLALLHAADTLMYEVKTNGKRGIRHVVTEGVDVDWRTAGSGQGARHSTSELAGS